MFPKYSEVLVQTFNVLTETNYFFLKGDIYSGYGSLLELKKLLALFNEYNESLDKKYEYIQRAISQQLIQSYNLLGIEINFSNTLTDKQCFSILSVLIFCLDNEPYYSDDFYELLVFELRKLNVYLEIKISNKRRNQLKENPDQVMKMINELFIFKGEFENAKLHMNKFLKEIEENQQDKFLPFWQKLSGQYKLYSGDYKGAIEDLNLSLKGFIKRNDILQQSDLLVYLVYLYIEIKDRTNAEMCLHIIEQIDKTSNQKKVELRRKICYGIIEKFHNRAINKVNALRTFQEIFESRIIENRLTILSGIYTCELLMWELKDSLNEDIISDIENVISKLIEIAYLHNSAPLFIDIYLIQSRLALLRLNISEALDYIRKAEEVVEEKSLSLFQPKVEKIKVSLQKELNQWNELVKRNAPILDRLLTANIDEFFDKVIKSITAIS